MKCLFPILIIIVFPFCFHLHGAEAHNDLPGLPTSFLLQEGEKCLEADSLEERAAAAFNLIVNRYYKNPTDTALRHAVVIALRHLGNINLTHNIDYRKAYRNLHLARQIATDDGNDYQLAFILNSLAALYTTNTVDNDSIAAMAQRLLAEALHTALRSNNQSLLPTIGINIAYTHFSKGNWGIFDEDIHKFEKVRFDSINAAEGAIAKTLIKATDAFFSKNYELCENLLHKVKASPMPHERYAERYDNTFDMFLIEFYTYTSQDEKAIDIMKEVLDKAKKNKNKDYELIMSYRLARTYEGMGQKDSLDKYYNQYLNLKDVFRVESGYGEIETLDFLSEIEQINKELENLSIQHQMTQRRFMVTVSVLVIISTILLALLFVYLNLKRTHRNLFMRNEEALKRERQHKLLREEWEKERAALEQKVQELTSASEMSSAPAAIAPEDTEDCNLPVDSEEEDSHIEISEADREIYMKLYTRILKVMEENPVIFQPNFSLSELATLLRVTPRAVSRAVNVCHNSNFPQLLIEYRIREVTRLMHDPDTSDWTIEAIAEKAGFKSRTSFSRLFKKTIGLTPSEYAKMAKERKDT